MKGCAMAMFILSVLVCSSVSQPSVSCPQLNCRNPCEFPGFRGRDEAGCASCECNCPILEECILVDCPAGQVPITQPASVSGCARCVCVDENNKPGTCPSPPISQGGPCEVKCDKDGDCAGNQKCCGNCPRICTAPVKKQLSKPGSCPKSDVVGICQAKCTDDADCPGNEKCCGNCPRKCTAPTARRQARTSTRCPAKFQRLKRRCNRLRRSRCSSNADCRNGRICCGSCVKRCIRVRRKNRLNSD